MSQNAARSPSVREETQQPDVCVYCKQPITQQQWPYKGPPSGEKAHLACYLDHMDEEENELGR
jgi:hypothetical protein